MEKKNDVSVVFGFQALLLPENASTMEDLVKLAKSIGLDYVVIKPCYSINFQILIFMRI